MIYSMKVLRHDLNVINVFSIFNESLIYMHVIYLNQFYICMRIILFCESYVYLWVIFALNEPNIITTRKKNFMGFNLN